MCISFVLEGVHVAPEICEEEYKCILRKENLDLYEGSYHNILILFGEELGVMCLQYSFLSLL